ncbi:MAG: hypothetical protein ABWJ98_02525 [Hydrogenothermaceae bacterium]
MENNYIDESFNEGQSVQSALWKSYGESATKIIEKFSYKVLEALRKQDASDITREIIRLYFNLENRKVPDFFKEMLKNPLSMSQIGYSFLLGLNSYYRSENAQQKNDAADNSNTEENINEEE